MKREIKFRAKRKSDNQWVTGDLVHNSSMQCFIENRQKWNYSDFVYKNTVGQFTGLKDNNGTEIYEGDIVLVKSAWGVTYLKGRVIYNIHKCQFMIFNEDDNGYLSMFNDNNTYEVLGNIYDNHELLNK